MDTEKMTLDNALELLPEPPGRQVAELFRHCSMTLKLYAPKGRDDQVPHEQDEVYMIARGSGWFVNAGSRHRFETGQMLFVPAGAEHRFEDFSDDFAAWVVFYGPGGGESREG